MKWIVWIWVECRGWIKRCNYTADTPQAAARLAGQEYLLGETDRWRIEVYPNIEPTFSQEGGV